MDGNKVPTTGLGVGVAFSDAAIQFAIAREYDDIALVAETRLPIAYMPTGNLARPLGFVDWLSDLPIPVVGADGRVSRQKAVAVMKVAFERGLKAAESIIGQRIDYISFGVAPSLSERRRARLRAVLDDLSVDARLVNEGRAALNFCRRSIEADSVLLYNLRLNSVTGSVYRFEGINLIADRLEISEESGWNFLILALMKACMNTLPPSGVDLPQYHAVFTGLKDAFHRWRPDEPIEIGLDNPSGSIAAVIAADAVKAAVAETFNSSFAAARQMIEDAGAAPAVMMLSLFSCHPFIRAGLQQALGLGVGLIERKSIWKGLAASAWEAKGRPALRMELPKTAPRIVEPFKPVAPDSPSFQMRDFRGMRAEQRPEQKQLSGPEIQARFKHSLERLIHSVGTLEADEIEALAPGLQAAAEEFLAKIQDQRAKRHIDRHEFGAAYQIYRKFWDRTTGYQILSAPAIGLCLTQTRSAFREARFKAARDWIKKGLYFDGRHQELQSYKKQLKTMASKGQFAPK